MAGPAAAGHVRNALTLKWLALLLLCTARADRTDAEDGSFLREKRTAESSGITLTFVFDSTGSMTDELSQVKKAMQEIFDYMKANRAKEIANYALVEFNDPYAKLLTITTDAKVYRNSLSTIRVNGGGDCPEMAMQGLKVALEASLPNSYLFVFTDASAKDYPMKTEVENLVQRKKSKIVFVLTGKCGSESDPAYQAYHSVARISNGHVFNLLKNEVNKVLDFVKLDTGKKGVVGSGYIPSKIKTAISTTVDPSMKEITVTVAGKKPVITFTDPKGNKTEGTTILDLDSVKSTQVKDPIPGNWTINVETKSPGRFVIMTESSFNFIYGFSLKPTEDMSETAPRPLIGTQNAVLIQLTNHTNDIHLIDVKIKDTKENVLKTMELHPIQERNGTYKAEMFLPPVEVFLLEVSGRDTKGNSIIRISDSGISPQSPASPIITLNTELSASLKSPFTLACHVESLVPFNASWNKGTVNVVPEKPYLQSAQVFYNISNTDMSTGGIYTCKAKNVAGTASKNIRLNVQVPPPRVKTSETIELFINKPGEISCHVESDVDYTVTWTRKTSSGTVQTLSGSKFIIKPTGNLVISTVEKTDEGEYRCTAKNIFGSGESAVSVKVTEPLQVKIVSDKSKFKSQEHIELSCVVKGSEPIALVWKKDGKMIEKSDRRLMSPETNKLLLKIRYAERNDAGVYECQARNKINKASGTTELKYLEKPKIQIQTSSPPAFAGTKYEMKCFVTGSPQPTLSWTKNGHKILSGDYQQMFLNGTLLIPKLYLNHTGQYQCSAENEVGRADAKANVAVVSIPHFDSDKTEIDVELYKNESIICNVNGNPHPTTTWERNDGKPISGRFSKGPSCSMTLTNAHPEDQGTYVVTATNKYGVQKKIFNVQISGMEKPLLVTGNREELGIVGKRKELTCVVMQGKPTPKLAWYKDGEALDETELSKVEGKIAGNGSLIFSFIKHDNEGTYHCEAVNIVGTTLRKLNLKVHEAPGFTDDMYLLLKAKIGNAVTLPCKMYGNPKPRITWLKDSKPITLSPLIAYSDDDDSLLIMSTTLENNGTYECQAINSAGRNKKRIDLFIQNIPRILPTATDIYTEKGDEIELPCNVESFPVARIKWLKNGSPYESSSISYTENKSIIRLTTDLTSSGEYTCIATNEAGRDKLGINITVTVVPYFESSEEYIQASRGDNVTLLCYTDSVPPADYYWLKHPDTIPVLSDSLITFENVDETYAGLYRCDALNVAGFAQKTFILTVYVPPSITAEIPDKQFLRRDTDFDVPCFAAGVPPPKVRWLKNGKPLPASEDEGLLDLRNITQYDAGIYTCIAENYEGSDEQNMEIIVGAPPEMDKDYRKTVDVNEGSASLVFCPAINGIPTPTVQWFKGGALINPTRRVSPKDKQRVLSLKKIKQSDQGMYTCVASNSVGQAHADILVNVMTAPRFKNGTANVDVNQLRGTTLLLDCSNTGKPTPKVSWLRNNHPLLPLLTPHIQISGKQVIIRNSTLADQTSYKCIVENKAGLIERSFNVKLFVRSEEEGYIKPGKTGGTWGPWSAWSSCTASCGRSEKVRKRKCASTDASCDGQSEQWGLCFVGDCKVDGEWSQWGNWSSCSAICGSGRRFRERFCNNPAPKYGGEICSGTNRQHESCNTNPCPVDGFWSEWTPWQACTGVCANSTTKRTRKCTNPMPAFGGKTCSGPKVEYKLCTQEKCPVDGGWSEWSSWSPCSAKCGYSTSFRERLCDNPRPKLNGAICKGDNRESRICKTETCDKIPLHATVQVKGSLNEQNIPETTILVNISDQNTERLIASRSANAFAYKASVDWYPYLSLVISPVTWLTAFQKGTAVNGFTLTKGVFNMKTFVKFTSGQEVIINHIGEGVGSDGALKIHADIQGKTPLFPFGTVKMEPYEENYIQSGIGELFVNSRNILEGGGLSIPYSWNKTIKYEAELGTLPTLVEKLTVQNIKTRKQKHKEEGIISPRPESTCPSGFEQMEEGYCKDVNECEDRHKNYCHFSQTCVNYKGSYSCTCPKGFKAPVMGGKCTDVDECAADPFICSHKCVNLEGTFKCLCPPGLALLDSETVCTSILPIKRTEDGEIEDWRTCLPKQTEVDGMCEDENPCADSAHMCGDSEICVNVHGLYRCISVPCPTEFKQEEGTKNCIKYCSTGACDSGAKISEIVIPIVVAPGGPIAPHKDLTHLPLNIDRRYLWHTTYKITRNAEGKPFRVKSVDGIGIIYSTAYLPVGQEYRVTVVASTYDETNRDILYSIKFIVIIHSPAD